MSAITPSLRGRGAIARTVVRWVLLALGAFVLGWVTWAAVSWARYGRGSRTAHVTSQARRFLPNYEVEERFRANVRAPAPLTFAVAKDMNLDASPVIRAIFHARERLMGSGASKPFPAGGVVEQMRSLGWGVLDSSPHEEIVLGAVTQPWNRDVVFRALSPGEFAAFDTPGFVKIVVTIAASPTDSGASLLEIGTYVATTDPIARARFRRYWAVFSPGILLIRSIALSAVKREAEHRFQMIGSRRAAARQCLTARLALLARRRAALEPWLREECDRRPTGLRATERRADPRSSGRSRAG
jgi:hypothetical protein